MDQCKDCEFFLIVYKTEDWGTYPIFFCRRYPTEVLVDPDHWCGEYKFKEYQDISKTEQPEK